ncbi:MAG TPA: peptidoglycan DD-metalloendopeptidase family protein [Tissierellales bacterium]|nr:peptidoglycan DD-metalloendopeptidase family protein [Tissierellales bacterium]
MVFSGYRVTSNYGWRIHPISKVRKFHAGIDLVKSHNAIIKAFMGGTVIYAGLGKSGTGVGGYGNVVVIKDIYGKAHVYAHLNSVLVQVGQVVNTNTSIGRQGATGKVTGSHLHYEIRNNASVSLGWTAKQENSTVDPTKYIKKHSKNKGSGRKVVTLKVDGKRGTATKKRWQQFLGTKQDGVLSKPSNAIKAWQEFLNKYGGAKLKVDGYEGTKTIKASQKFFGTKKDGVISTTSNMVKELQIFLNNYGR